MYCKRRNFFLLLSIELLQMSHLIDAHQDRVDHHADGQEHQEYVQGTILFKEAFDWVAAHLLHTRRGANYYYTPPSLYERIASTELFSRFPKGRS